MTPDQGTDRRCNFIKENGQQCKLEAEPNSDFCHVHRNPQKHIDKAEPAKMGSDNPNYIHGLHSDMLLMPCTERCYMYDICTVKTDTPEGHAKYGGICYYECGSQTTQESLLTLDGMKNFIANHLIKIDRRINRGTRFELVTGGFLSEPEISGMQRNVSALGFGMLQIMEKEQFAAIQNDVKELKKLYEKHIKKIESEGTKR